MRIVLAAFGAGSIAFLRRAIAVRFSKDASVQRACPTVLRSDDVQVAFLVLCIVQFHTVYYASRPLPNVFATILTTTGLAFWLREDYVKLVKILTVTMVRLTLRQHASTQAIGGVSVRCGSVCWSSGFVTALSAKGWDRRHRICDPVSCHSSSLSSPELSLCFPHSLLLCSSTP